MDALVIEQSMNLKGKVRISGAKNAALPILFATLLFENQVTLNEVPQLRDIYTTLKLLEILGCETTFNDNTVEVLPKEIESVAPYDLVKTMRASVLCLGPLLARNSYAKVAMPGGCAIGSRPVDLHLSALEKMGAEFELSEGYIIGKCDKLKGANIYFDFPTVGGTENLIMAATLAEGTTTLENCAREPEIVDLVKFLRAGGAKISGEGTSIITIEGVTSLSSTTYSVMPDRIEAGTFLIAAGMTDGDIYLENCVLSDMEATIDKLTSMGLSITEENGLIRSKRANGHISGVDISTRPYPGFPTDMQAQMMAIMSIADSPSLVEETIFENRFMHVQELIRMGADIKITGSSAMIRGVDKLRGAPVMASDLRASASLVLAALAAEGKTKIQRIYHLDRGYEQMEVKLSALGAKIIREKE